ncbi:hypothetical protein DL95DRAFT_474811 [Leptodontidium sp. 2 PMI_412]|nr:hypothetical protein DL95DRAFT_474811 [Leptodontidium sp. 2 PMI_412]
MKIPPGFLDVNGKVAKGEIILAKSEDPKTSLQEFGITVKDNMISSYVLTSPGDILVLSFAVNANIADHADFVVDGVLRNCHSDTLSELFQGAFKKVIYQVPKSNGRRAAVKYSKMKVKERGTVKAVGTLELRLYRTDHASSEEAMPSDSEAPITERARRTPAFDNCAEWYDCNSNVNFEGTPPPFQIEFFDHTSASRLIKDKVLKDLPANCKLWATFVFHLRSAADLRHMGFDCPTYYSTPSPPPPTPSSLTESNPSKTRNVEQDLEDTSIGNTLVQEFTERTPKKIHKDTEVQKIKAAPRPTCVMAPSTTLTGLLSGMPNANRDEPLGAGENSDVGSSWGSTNPSKDRPSHVGNPDAAPRYYLSQGIGFSNNSAGLQGVPVVQPPESATATMAFKNSKEVVEPKEEPIGEYDTPRKSLERHPIFLSGVGGPGTSPAHQAFLQRAATQESETCPATAMHDDLFCVGGDNIANVRLSSQQTTPDVFFPSRRGLSQPPEALVSMEGEKFGYSGSQGEALGSTWKPLTPPVASSKRQILSVQRGSVRLDDFWRPATIKPSGLAAEEPALPANSQDRMSTLSSTYLERLQETPSYSVLENSTFSFANPAVPGLKTLQEVSDNQFAFSRAPSQAPSDSDTEVADPEDIDRAVRASQRSTQTTNASQIPLPQVLDVDLSGGSSFKSELAEDDQRNHTYPNPVLGCRRYSTERSNIGSPLSKSFTARTESGPRIGSPAKEIIEHWEPQPRAPHHAPSNSPKPQQVSSKGFPSTQSIKEIDTKLGTPVKRKSDGITGNTTPESPRKTTTAPADRNEKFENDKAVAEARIATAERKREELQKRLEAARELSREMDKIRELNQKAADVERENAEMEAEISLIYGGKNDR